MSDPLTPRRGFPDELELLVFNISELPYGFPVTVNTPLHGTASFTGPDVIVGPIKRFSAPAVYEKTAHGQFPLMSKTNGRLIKNAANLPDWVYGA